MSEFAQLLLILGLVYLSDCISLVRAGAVVVASWVGRPFQIFHAAFGFGGRGNGLIFASPVPWASAFIGEQWPISISPQGVYAYVATTPGVLGRGDQSSRWFAFLDIKRVASDGKVVLVNGESIATATTSTMAARTAHLIDRVRKSAEHQRAQAINSALISSLNTAAIRRRMHRLRWPMRWLRFTSTLVMLHVFGSLPLMAASLPTARWLLPWCGILLCLVMLTAVQFWRLHRALHRRRTAERIGQTALMFIAPILAIRAAGSIDREMLGRYHPLAIALATIKPDSCAAFSRAILCDVVHPIEPVVPADTPAAAAETERWYRTRLKSAIDLALSEAGLNVASSLVPGDIAGAAYCPRCHAQFTTAEARCRDCNLSVVARQESSPRGIT